MSSVDVRMAGTLLLAPSRSQVNEVMRVARTEARRGARVVVSTADSRVADTVRRAGLEVTDLDGYPGAPEVWKDAARTSHDWYRSSEGDLSAYEGLSLGGIVEVDMFVYLSRVIEDVDRLKRVVAAERPGSVWLGAEARPSWSRLMPIVSPRSTVRRLGGSRGSMAKEAMRRWSLKEWLKEASLDRQARALVLTLPRRGLLRRAPQAATAGAKPNILVIADIPTPSVLGSIVPVIRALSPDHTFVLAADPRVISRLKDVQAAFVSHTAGDLAGSWGAYRAAGDVFHKRWREFRRRVEDGRMSFPYKGADLWPALAPKFRRLFLRQFPFTVAEAFVAALILRRYRIKTIVTASHAHHAGRLYSDVGAKLGIPSLSLQHGVAGVPSVYAPVHSTKMAVWGELPRQWLIDNGANPEQLVVTGQPRLDALLDPGPPLTRTQVLARLGLDASRSVWIVAPDPAPREVRHAMTEMAFAIASEFRDTQVIIRPHPDDDANFYTARIAARTCEGRITLVTGIDAASLLAASELVFVGQSTLGLEAMVLDRPVVVLNPSRLFEFVPYVREAAAPAVYEAAEVAPTVLRLLGVDRSRFEKGRHRFVERYASAADGRSTARVVDLIERMARGTA